MIDEYNQELKKPVKIGDQLFKYVPSNVNIDM